MKPSDPRSGNSAPPALGVPLPLSSSIESDCGAGGDSETASTSADVAKSGVITGDGQNSAGSVATEREAELTGHHQPQIAPGVPLPVANSSNAIPSSGGGGSHNRNVNIGGNRRNSNNFNRRNMNHPGGNMTMNMGGSPLKMGHYGPAAKMGNMNMNNINMNSGNGMNQKLPPPPPPSRSDPRYSSGGPPPHMNMNMNMSMNTRGHDPRGSGGINNNMNINMRSHDPRSGSFLDGRRNINGNNPNNTNNMALSPPGAPRGAPMDNNLRRGSNLNHRRGNGHVAGHNNALSPQQFHHHHGGPAGGGGLPSRSSMPPPPPPQQQHQQQRGPPPPPPPPRQSQRFGGPPMEGSINQAQAGPRRGPNGNGTYQRNSRANNEPNGPGLGPGPGNIMPPPPHHYNTNGHSNAPPPPPASGRSMPPPPPPHQTLHHVQQQQHQPPYPSSMQNQHQTMPMGGPGGGPTPTHDTHSQRQINQQQHPGMNNSNKIPPPLLHQQNLNSHPQQQLQFSPPPRQQPQPPLHQPVSSHQQHQHQHPSPHIQSIHQTHGMQPLPHGQPQQRQFQQVLPPTTTMHHQQQHLQPHQHNVPPPSSGNTMGYQPPPLMAASSDAAVSHQSNHGSNPQLHSHQTAMQVTSGTRGSPDAKNSSSATGVLPFNNVAIPNSQVQQQPAAQAGPSTAASKPLNDNSTTVDAAGNWSTHKAPTGVNYYYNSVTKVSTYTRPACLGVADSSATNTSPVSTATSIPGNTAAAGTTSVVNNISNSNKSKTGNSSTSKGKKRKWTEYTDQASGKKYYFDGVTTTWDKPSDLNLSSSSGSEDKNESSAVSSMVSSSSSSTKKKKKKYTFEDYDYGEDGTMPKKKKKKDKKKGSGGSSCGDSADSDNPVVYNNKIEAIAAFKGLLLAKDVSPTAKWNDVVKLCSADARWEACATLGERKQAFAEYQTKRANELREEKRQEKMRAKDAFMSLLTDVLPGVRSFNASANTRFHEVRDALSKDDRFYAVDDEGTREDLFYDFVEELRKREERQKRGRKRDAKDAFIAFLKYREEGGGLTFASTWTSFLASLDEKDKADVRFTKSTAMSDSDRQLYFADYVIELQVAEDEKRRRIRDARRRAEKAQRDAYRETLRTMAVEGKILPSTRWRNMEDILSVAATFAPVQAQDRDAPREMFEDFVEDWADGYRRDRSFLSRLISPSSKKAAVTIETSYEAFTKLLLEAAAYSPDVYSDARRVINREEPISSAKLYFDELVLRSKEASSMIGKSYRPKSAFGRRRSAAGGDESSEDEGEIVEDSEIEGESGTKDHNFDVIAESAS